MERLTNKKTAADLKRNVEGLQAAGVEPNISDLRYIKLAEYENIEDVFKLTNRPPVKWQVLFMKRFLETR